MSSAQFQDYQVAFGFQNFSALQAAVNALLAKGYVPVGGVAVFGPQLTPTFYQAMALPALASDSGS